MFVASLCIDGVASCRDAMLLRAVSSEVRHQLPVEIAFHTQCSYYDRSSQGKNIPSRRDGGVQGGRSATNIKVPKGLGQRGDDPN